MRLLLRRDVRAVRVVAVHRADEHAGVGLEFGARGAGILESVDGRLEEDTQLRIHEFGLARRDAEILGVEAIHLVEKAGPVRPVVLQRPHEELAMRIDGRHGHGPALEQRPQVRRRLRTRAAEVHSDHSDVAGRRRRRRILRGLPSRPALARCLAPPAARCGWRSRSRSGARRGACSGAMGSAVSG